LKKALLFLSLLASVGWCDTTTNRLGLTLPTIGSPTWGQKVNNNFQILDATVNINGGSGGGGSTGGSIVASTQGTVGWYSAVATNTISGITQGTSGQILTTGGGTGSPFWSSNLPSGSTNYIAASSSGTYIWNTSSLQSGATFYVSSGTVQQQLIVGPATQGSPFGISTEFVFTPEIQTIGGGAITLYNESGTSTFPNYSLTVSTGFYYNGLSITGTGLTWSQNGVSGLNWSNGNLRLGNNGNAYNAVAGFGTIDSPSGTAVEVVGHSKVANAFAVAETVSGGPYAEQVSTQGIVTDNALTVSSAATFNGNLIISSTVIDGSGSAGTSGYVFTSHGAGTSPTWQVSSGGGGASTLATAYNGTQVTSPTVGINVISPLVAKAASSTMTLSVDLSTTAPASGSGNYIQNTSSLQSGATFYVSSGTVFGPFNAYGTTIISSTTKIILSNSATNGPAGLVIYTTSPAHTAILPLTASVGPDGGGSQSSEFYILVDSQNLKTQFVSYSANSGPMHFQFSNASENGYMLDMTSGTATFGQFESLTTQSSTTFNGNVNVSSGVLLSGSAGTSGQAFTSNGPGTVPTWQTVSSGGGSTNGTILSSTPTALAVYSNTTTINGSSLVNVYSSSMTVNGSGTGSIVLTIGGSTYTVVSSSIQTPTVGDYLVITSTNFTVGQSTGTGGGGGGGTPGGSSGQVQYNSAGSFGGSSDFQFNGTSVTIQSSVTIGNYGPSQNPSPGVLDLYSSNATNTGGQPLLTIGSVQQTNQIIIADEQPINLERYGGNIGSLSVGLVASSDGHIIFDANSLQNQIDFWNSGEMDLETASTGNGGKNIVLMPNTVSEVTVSSLGVTVSTSETITGSDTVNGNMTAALVNTTNGYQQNGTTILYSSGSSIGDLSVGRSAMPSDTGFGRNVAAGFDALNSNTTGQANVAVGYAALFGQNNSSNTAVGYEAAETGGAGATNNTFVGFVTGKSEQGKNNVYIGAQTDSQTGNLTNAIAIGQGLTPAASNQVLLGNSSIVSTVLQGSVSIAGPFIPSSTTILGNGQGSAGQVYTSQGGSVPTWTTISGGSGGGVTVPSTFTWTGILASSIQVTGGGGITDTFGLVAGTGTFTSSVTVNAGLYIVDTSSGNALVISTATTGVQLLSVSSTPAVAQSDFLLNISSTSGAMALGVQNNSHVVSSGTTPSVSSCGTGSPAVVGTDMAGTITVGGGSVTACTLNFANPYANPPVCVESDNSTTPTADITSISTTAVTFGFSASLGGGTIWYICIGNKG
jgi:hypothetical protein